MAGTHARTMVIWLYNDAMGYARLVVQNEVSLIGIWGEKIGGGIFKCLMSMVLGCQIKDDISFGRLELLD